MIAIHRFIVILISSFYILRYSIRYVHQNVSFHGKIILTHLKGVFNLTERMNIFIYSKHDEDSLNKKSMVEDALIHEGFTMTDNDKEANIIISIGSDGSFLQAVRKTGFRQDCLYAGISVTGKHSLYCDFHYNNLYEMTQAIREAEIEVRRYPLIEVTIDDHRTILLLE